MRGDPALPGGAPGQPREVVSDKTIWIIVCAVVWVALIVISMSISLHSTSPAQEYMAELIFGLAVILLVAIGTWLMIK